MKIFVIFLVTVLAVPSLSQYMRGTNNTSSDVLIARKMLSEEILESNMAEEEYKAYTVRAIVKCLTENGKQLAKDHAVSIYHDFAKVETIVGEYHAKSIIILENSEDIKSVEYDGIWAEQGYLEEHLEGDRRLQEETTPYGIAMVQADKVAVGNWPVTVCLLDTGAAARHPDLPDSIISGVNRQSDIDDAELYWYLDMRGHGTHVAGTVSAKANNGIGVRGIGDVPLFITRALDDQGRARESDVLEALDQCEQSDAKIISLSLGGGSLSTAFQETLDYLIDVKGLLVFAAAGNDGERRAVYPAAYSKVVSVAAVNATGQHWHASNTGPWVEIAAPGDNVLSTSVNDRGEFVYSTYSGTSMSVPHAAGVAALLWSSFPECTNKQIRYSLAYTAKDVTDQEGSFGCDENTGFGIIQALEAWRFLRLNPCSGANWGRKVTDGGCRVIDQLPE